MDTATAPASEQSAAALPTYEIDADRLPELEERVAKVNARLARHGAIDRFSYTAEPYLVEHTDVATGISTAYEMVRVQLNAAELKVAGYTFLATLVREEAGMVVRCAPGQNLDGWTRPDDHDCHYCHTARTRTKSYVVRVDETGEILQVGNSCLQPMLGIRPSALWLLELDLEELVPTGPRAGMREPAPLHRVRQVLATAWAVSNEGRDWLSAAKAREWGKPSTAAETREVMTWRPRGGKVSPEYVAWIHAMRAAAASVPAEQIDAILADGLAMDPGTDYADNMAVVLAGEHVSGRSFGLLVSLISVHFRASGRRREASARPAVVSEALGEEKDKLTGIDVTVLTLLEMEGFHYGSWSTLIIMQADSGHMIKWKASGLHPDIERGGRYRIERATVKEAAEYEGVVQTVVVRAKMVPIESAAK